MPPKVKKDLSFSILSMMGGVFVAGLMSFMGLELIESHDDNIKSKHISEQVDKIAISNDAFIERTDALLAFMNENKTNIKVVDTKLEERFLIMREKVNYNTNQITYLKGRVSGR